MIGRAPRYTRFGRNTIDETLRMDTKVDGAAELHEAIAETIAEIERRRARMRSDQAEIERLKADSKALRAETLALLATLKMAA
ncbi:MAG: hypothetical protein ACRDI2_00630 [Chloroflexota bacterium]